LLYGLGLQQRLELPVERVSCVHHHWGDSTPEAQSMSKTLARALGGSCSKSARIASWIALFVLNMSLQISFFSSSV
jgi:hypothetical protein